MRIGVPWELGRSLSLHKCVTIAGPGTRSESLQIVWLARRHAMQAKWRVACGTARRGNTEAYGTGLGSLSAFIVPIESRVTGPDGSLRVGKGGARTRNRC